MKENSTTIRVNTAVIWYTLGAWIGMSLETQK